MFSTPIYPVLDNNSKQCNDKNGRQHAIDISANGVDDWSSSRPKIKLNSLNETFLSENISTVNEREATSKGGREDDDWFFEEMNGETANDNQCDNETSSAASTRDDAV